MIRKFQIRTKSEEMQNITSYVKDTLRESGVSSGLCIIYCPHTTAGITINENADPDVVKDMLFAFRKTFPDRAEFRHAEGNSAAHQKASCVGSSAAVPIEDGSLLLGIWQGIYFCEFDGPRARTFFVKIIEG